MPASSSTAGIGGGGTAGADLTATLTTLLTNALSSSSTSSVSPPLPPASTFAATMATITSDSNSAFSAKDFLQRRMSLSSNALASSPAVSRNSNSSKSAYHQLMAAMDSAGRTIGSTTDGNLLSAASAYHNYNNNNGNSATPTPTNMFGTTNLLQSVMANSSQANGSGKPSSFPNNLIPCVAPGCSCRNFDKTSDSYQQPLRECKCCRHGWTLHALSTLASQANGAASTAAACFTKTIPTQSAILNAYLSDPERPTAENVYDIASLVLYAAHAIPVRLKILLDRLFSVLSQDDATHLIEAFGWSIDDYARGYKVEDKFGRPVMDNLEILSRFEETLVLMQFLRFQETKHVAQKFLLQLTRSDMSNGNNNINGSQQLVSNGSMPGVNGADALSSLSSMSSSSRLNESAIKRFLDNSGGNLSTSSLSNSSASPAMASKLLNGSNASSSAAAAQAAAAAVLNSTFNGGINNNTAAASALFANFSSAFASNPLAALKSMQQQQQQNPSSNMATLAKLLESVASAAGQTPLNCTMQQQQLPSSNNMQSPSVPRNAASSLSSAAASSSNRPVSSSPYGQFNNNSTAITTTSLSNGFASLANYSNNANNSGSRYEADTSSTFRPPAANTANNTDSLANSTRFNISGKSGDSSQSMNSGFGDDTDDGADLDDDETDDDDDDDGMDDSTHAADAAIGSYENIMTKNADGTINTTMNPNGLKRSLQGTGRRRNKRVACEDCGNTFCDRGALKIHVSAVHLKEMHQCTVPGCNMVFSSRRSRNRHSANKNPRLHMNAFSNSRRNGIAGSYNPQPGMPSGNHHMSSGNNNVSASGKCGSADPMTTLTMFNQQQHSNQPASRAHSLSMSTSHFNRAHVNDDNNNAAATSSSMIMASPPVVHSSSGATAASSEDNKDALRSLLNREDGSKFAVSTSKPAVQPPVLSSSTSLIGMMLANSNVAHSNSSADISRPNSNNNAVTDSPDKPYFMLSKNANLTTTTNSTSSSPNSALGAIARALAAAAAASSTTSRSNKSSRAGDRFSNNDDDDDEEKLIVDDDLPPPATSSSSHLLYGMGNAAHSSAPSMALPGGTLSITPKSEYDTGVQSAVAKTSSKRKSQHPIRHVPGGGHIAESKGGEKLTVNDNGSAGGALEAALLAEFNKSSNSTATPSLLTQQLMSSLQSGNSTALMLAAAAANTSNGNIAWGDRNVGKKNEEADNTPPNGNNNSFGAIISPPPDSSTTGSSTANVNIAMMSTPMTSSGTSGLNIPQDPANPCRCVECGKEFRNHFTFRTHYQNVHLRVMHRCKVAGCNAEFPSKRSRDRHSANINLHRRLMGAGGVGLSGGFGGEAGHDMSATMSGGMSSSEFDADDDADDENADDDEAAAAGENGDDSKYADNKSFITKFMANVAAAAAANAAANTALNCGDEKKTSPDAVDSNNNDVSMTSATITRDSLRPRTHAVAAVQKMLVE